MVLSCPESAYLTCLPSAECQYTKDKSSRQFRVQLLTIDQYPCQRPTRTLRRKPKSHAIPKKQTNNQTTTIKIAILTSGVLFGTLRVGVPVVVLFYRWFKFYFLLFLTHSRRVVGSNPIWCSVFSEFPFNSLSYIIISKKERKIKFEPKIKLNHNIPTNFQTKIHHSFILVIRHQLTVCSRKSFFRLSNDSFWFLK